MVAKVKEVAEYQLMPYDAQYRPYNVMMSGRVLLITQDPEQAAWMVRLLNVAKDENRHNAMNILCLQLGFGEEFAKHVWYDLKASDYDNPASWDESSTTLQ